MLQPRGVRIAGSARLKYRPRVWGVTVKRMMHLLSATIGIGFITTATQRAAFDHIETAHRRTEVDTQVSVSVYNDAEVPPDILTRAEKRAAKIFSRSSLDVT